MDGEQIKNWKGLGGVIPRIKKDLGYKHNSGASIERVLLEILLCESEGRRFDPKAIGRKGHKEPTFALDWWKQK